MNQALIVSLGVYLPLNVVMVESEVRTQQDGRMLFVRDLHHWMV
jgi:hypothetical protein